jgi:hypothetical protein
MKEPEGRGDDMRASRSGVLAFCLSMLGLLAAAPARSADGIDAEADSILKAMSSYMAATKAFSINAEVALEVVMKNGQKLQLMSSETLLVQRPSRFDIRVKGMVADAEFVFDGKTLTLYGRRNNVYVQRNVTGTIDDAIRAFEAETGLTAAGADLLFADPYAVLSEGVESSAYLGTAYVDGIECHHLAFREDRLDWQLWVRTGDAPLPMRYVITSTWQTGAPQLEVSLRDWNTSPQIGERQFTFSAPKGARKLDAMPTGDLDDVQYAKEGQR